ncbi:MAG: hypothetical protein ABEJ70_06245 [Halobacteriaceae archaeon]
MPREDLQAASDALRRAASAVDDESVEERLYEQSRQMADLATRDRGPDHGRLARHMSALDELADATDGEAREAVEAALEHVTAYRETVEGV